MGSTILCLRLGDWKHNTLAWPKFCLSWWYDMHLLICQCFTHSFLSFCEIKNGPIFLSKQFSTLLFFSFFWSISMVMRVCICANKKVD
jgi:hypothetical protein